jgi:hypothetical protein
VAGAGGAGRAEAVAGGVVAETTEAVAAVRIEDPELVTVIRLHTHQPLALTAAFGAGHHVLTVIQSSLSQLEKITLSLLMGRQKPWPPLIALTLPVLKLLRLSMMRSLVFNVRRM